MTTGNHRPPNAGKGRPKGIPNKATASIKAAITAAFEQMGGVSSLVAWGKKNPAEFYKLWGRLAPQEVSGVEGGAIEVRVRFVEEPRADG